jgi:teichoic acid transport system ATP-binding protein
MVSIAFQNVDKYFYLQHQKTIKELVHAIFKKQKTLERIHALRNLSFEIGKGETVGIIGKNGAGKSTLLKLIAGVSSPTNGKVQINGKVAPLIELGAGFHPELSGRENVFLNGVILGMKEKQIEEKFQSIVDFAGLEKFIDMPIKYYSSGMYTRLAFSVAVSIDPDILLVDEVLSVGDLEFQDKCLQKMNEFKKRGTTIILVAHGMDVIKQFSERVLFLQKGQLAYDGNVDVAIQKYRDTN